jgi:hypothetical protein
LSRLKKIANGSDPYINVKIEKMVSNPSQNPNEDKIDAFLLAKQLIAALPISPSNSVTHVLADALAEGALGSIEGDNVDFGALLKAAQDFLKTKGILVAKKKD